MPATPLTTLSGPTDALLPLLHDLSGCVLAAVALVSFAMLARSFGALTERAARAAAQPVVIRTLMGRMVAAVVLSAGLMTAVACLPWPTPGRDAARDMAVSPGAAPSAAPTRPATMV